MVYYFISTLLSIAIIYYFRSPFFRSHLNKKQLFLIQFIALLPLTIISSVRWNVGTDTWHTYTPEYLAMKSETVALSEEEESIMFNCYKLYMKSVNGYSTEEISKLTLDEAYDFYLRTSKHTAPGFQFLERTLIHFNADVQWLYVVTSIIIMTFTALTIYYESSNPVVALLLFVITGNFFLSLNIISQYIAISICIFSCVFIEKRNLPIFIVLILLASLFHISATIFIIMYFVPHINIKPIVSGIIIVSFLILAPYLVPLFKNAIALFFPRYSIYFERVSNFEWDFFAINIAVFLFGSYYYTKGIDQPYFKLFYYANIIGTIALCFSGNIPLVKRINYYFACPHYLLLPIILQCEKNKKIKFLFSSCIISLYILETIISIGYLNKNQVLPYQTFYESNRIKTTESVFEIISD